MSLQSVLRSSALGQKLILPVWRALYRNNPVNLVKRTVLKTSFAFPSVKRKYYDRYRTDPTRAPLRNEMETMMRDGFVVLPGFFDKPTIDAFVREVDPFMKQVQDGTFTGTNKTYRTPEAGMYRLLQLDTICPATKVFFDHHVINAMAEAYVSAGVKSYQRMAELRPHPRAVSNSDHPHIDDWRMRFKAFLYLNDIGKEQAPFTYFRGSHRDAPWRRTVETRYYLEGSDGGYLTENERKAALPQYEEVVCTGSAGTLILADLRGLHRGTPLVSGRRLMLVNYFDVR